jgi:branched-subunit amino acid aminotransferase/4-amino-4-deoxychorismate lyase
MSSSLAYANGGFVSAAEVAIPLEDAGFVWGAVVTDRLRTFSGRPFRLDDHLRRFRQSCERARVPQPRPDSELAAVSERIIAENWAGHDLSVIWLAMPGPAHGPGPTLIAYTQPIDANRIARLHRAGAYLVTSPAALAVDPQIKHRSRLPWWIATRVAHERHPDAEPLFMDPATRHVLETPTANLVAVLDGVVTSPPTGTILDGVSLGVVRELCRGLAIPFAERPLAVPDLHRASEILLTNTTYCLAGVSRFDGRAVPFSGPILNRLLDAWTELVGTDVRAPRRS